MNDSGAGYILLAPNIGFQASMLTADRCWHVIIGDPTVGFLQEQDIKDWHGVDIFVRAAAMQLYGQQI